MARPGCRLVLPGIGVLLVASGFLSPTKLDAQQPPPPSLRARPLVEDSIRLDGLLDEPEWLAADSIPDLVMIDPTEGAPPTGRTAVRVLATSRYLLVGVIAYDPDPAGIVSFSKERDANIFLEDYILVVLDTFRDGRSGYVFGVNPSGARYDALIIDRGEGQRPTWDTVWEAATARGPWGWSLEIRIPLSSIAFAKHLDSWGLNIQRRIQRLQETSRWSGTRRDYEITQTSRAGLLTGLPTFDLGLGLTVRPALAGGGGVPEHEADAEYRLKPSLDVAQRIGPNVGAFLTVNTDFAETEVDVRQTNLTRFPLFFPEKRDFFLAGSDIFEFGIDRGTDVLPFFSRRIGLVEAQEVPIDVGLKSNGRVGNTNFGALAVRTRAVEDLVPSASMGVVRVLQNVFAESSAGVIATFGDPLGRSGSWLAGADFTYQTSRLAGDKNFLVGVWGLVTDREDLEGDGVAAGIKIDYPNDLWDVAFIYKRMGEGFDPSLGFVPRKDVQIIQPRAQFRPRPGWKPLRRMNFQLLGRLVLDLDGSWESYGVFTAPFNWDWETGDKTEFNLVPEGERLEEPFEIAEGVVIPPGSYQWLRYRVLVELASWRKVSGAIAWWFGSFYDGSLSEIKAVVAWKPSATVNFELSGEHNVGRLPAGDFTKDLFVGRVELHFTTDLNASFLAQYDNESLSVGFNNRIRWTFDPYGDLFVVYNHNIQDFGDRWDLESNGLTIKVQRAFRF
jgi:hypothetical protein